MLGTRTTWIATLFLLASTLLPSTLLAARPAAQDAPRKGSPFSALRWEAGSPWVLVDGGWYAPEKIEGVDVSEILAFCEERWPGKKEKRFGEDLVEAMNLMGHEVPAEVVLELRDAAGDTVVLEAVAVTLANRQAIRSGDVPPPARLTRERALADLDELSARLQDQFAYLELGGVDWKHELEQMRESLSERPSTAELATAIERFIARFRDGHAHVTSDALPRATRYPPFLVQDADEGPVAFLPDRSGFLDPDHPFVLAIDGVSVDAWVERASATIANGSPQFVRFLGLRALRDLELLRLPGDDVEADTIRVELSAGPGGATVEREVAFTGQRPTFGAWPRRASELLDVNVGYLRLAEMDERFVPRLRSAMADFRETDGLVVDVRGNGGGDRTLLIALAGYLTGPGEGPWIGNVARYRTSDRFDEGHLEARYMYRAADERWSEPQRQAIAALAETFEPEWRPPAGFSEWHYLVLGRTGHPDEYFYDKPVVVLSDAGCFSATDIFLGALSGRPRVTLMGAASGGGSARSQGFTLPHSGIAVRCASMASFRPDGRLYDGRGIEVEIAAAPRPEDFLVDGGDSVLEAAVERLVAAGDR